MDDMQLIAKLKELKRISPRKEWVILVKTQLFKSTTNSVPNKASFTGVWQNPLNMIFKKEFAYSLAALALVMGGALGFMNFSSIMSNDNMVKNSTAALAIESDLKNNVEIFKIKSQSLSQATKGDIKNISIAVNEVKNATKNVTETIKKDPQLASKVALDINNNKTYLDALASDDLKETSDDLYKTIDEQMIADLEKTTLTKDQQEAFVEIKRLYTKGDYSNALRNILLINRNSDSDKQQ